MGGNPVLALTLALITRRGRNVHELTYCCALTKHLTKSDLRDPMTETRLLRAFDWPGRGDVISIPLQVCARCACANAACTKATLDHLVNKTSRVR